MTDTPEMPDFKNMTLDFSQFHPLDHWPGSARCRAHYGGIRNHFQLAWDFKWADRVRGWTLCKVGRHDYRQWSRNGQPAGPRTCAGCGRETP